jgi:hypothetical protein
MKRMKDMKKCRTRIGTDLQDEERKNALRPDRLYSQIFQAIPVP